MGEVHLNKRTQGTSENESFSGLEQNNPGIESSSIFLGNPSFYKILQKSLVHYSNSDLLSNIYTLPT